MSVLMSAISRSRETNLRYAATKRLLVRSQGRDARSDLNGPGAFELAKSTSETAIMEIARFRDKSGHGWPFWF